MRKCLFCGREHTTEKSSAPGVREFMNDCVVCGRCDLGFRMVAVSPTLDERTRMALAAHTRQMNRLGETPTYELDNYEALAAQHLHTSVSRKLRLMLEVVAGDTKHPGDPVIVEPQTAFPLIDAATGIEVDYFLDALERRGDIRSFAGDAWMVTPQGWDRLEPAGGAGELGTCFVAMSFKKEMDPAYDLGIRPAVADDCGFEIVRVDRVEHVENINDRIMADLRRAQFVVADFTRHPAGVYFEAGFALGLGRLVIWTCHKDDFKEDKVHFDTRPYNHIVWTEPAELRGRLATRIKALLPDPKA